MQKQPDPRDDEPEIEVEDRATDNRFSQEDDDLAGRSWHVTSEDELVPGDDIEGEPPPGSERV